MCDVYVPIKDVAYKVYYCRQCKATGQPSESWLSVSKESKVLAVFCSQNCFDSYYSIQSSICPVHGIPEHKVKIPHTHPSNGC